MTKQEFKARWESDADGGWITFNDIVDCAITWHLCATPRSMSIDKVLYIVLKAANTNDADDFAPENTI